MGWLSLGFFFLDCISFAFMAVCFSGDIALHLASYVLYLHVERVYSAYQ